MKEQAFWPPGNKLRNTQEISQTTPDFSSSFYTTQTTYVNGGRTRVPKTSHSQATMKHRRTFKEKEKETGKILLSPGTKTTSKPPTKLQARLPDQPTNLQKATNPVSVFVPLFELYTILFQEISEKNATGSSPTTAPIRLSQSLPNSFFY